MVLPTKACNFEVGHVVPIHQEIARKTELVSAQGYSLTPIENMIPRIVKPQELHVPHVHIFHIWKKKVIKSILNQILET